MEGETIYYFAYASNMSSKRLLQSCPNAKFKCVAKLGGYELAFMGHKDEWAGAVANAVPKNDFIWGVVWELDKSDMKGLGGTESKPGDQYEHMAERCDVVLNQSESITCIYFRRDPRKCKAGSPSPQYLQLIINGAVEHNLDKDYIDRIRKIQTNGNTIITEGMQRALF